MTPYRSKAYLQAVRRLPCAACGVLPSGNAHHSRQGMGMGQKAPDNRAIPLCPGCHQHGRQALHRIGRKKWEELYGTENDHILRTIRELRWCPDNYPPDPE